MPKEISGAINRSDFPKDFSFGTATSSYQIEGTQFGVCGPNHWDKFARDGGTANGEDGAVACAHIKKWREDLDLIADCGMDSYRFSTAWARIQPDGQGAINDEGLDFYKVLVDGICERGIAPHLTLYHWDLPQPLADNGGWTNKDTAKRFADFAMIVGQHLGDKLESIATINEPWCIAWLSHFLGHHAPGLTDISAASKAMHNILLAHGLGMTSLRSVLGESAHCDLGIVLNMEVATPISDSDKHIRAAKIQDGIYNRWFADAIFKAEYPSDVLTYLEPHMPEDWQDDMDVISQPIDWLGLNYYTRNFIKDDGSDVFPFGQVVTPAFNQESTDRTSLNWEIYPEGLSYFLERIHTEYDAKVDIIVTENGMASFDKVTDHRVFDELRVKYFGEHLKAVKSSVDKGVPIKGYFAWSLLDNFEWAFGYDQRFGIVHVDFETQKRTPKESWYWWQRFLNEN